MLGTPRTRILSCQCVPVLQGLGEHSRGRGQGSQCCASWHAGTFRRPRPGPSGQVRGQSLQVEELSLGGKTEVAGSVAKGLLEGPLSGGAGGIAGMLQEAATMETGQVKKPPKRLQ